MGILCLSCFILAILAMVFLAGLILNTVGTLSMAWAIGLVIFMLFGAVCLLVETIGETRTYYGWMKEAKAENDLENAEEYRNWVLGELKYLWALPLASLVIVVYIVFELCAYGSCIIGESFSPQD